jgi:hypothetical protein
MRLRVGYELQYHFPQATPVIMILNVHYIFDLEGHIVINPSVPISGYHDGFGNWCSRILAPAGICVFRLTDTVVNDSGLPDQKMPHAAQVPVELLPDDALVFLIASRFLEAQMGIRLLTRTTRNVGLTEAGARLRQSLAPRIAEIEADIADLMAFRDKPFRPHQDHAF